MTIRKNKG